jgi:hypothetical protein
LVPPLHPRAAAQARLGLALPFQERDSSWWA